MDLSVLSGTQALAIWGAVTGTIGTITGALGLWLRFRQQKHDQARLKCEADFDFEVTNGVPRQKFKIVVRCVGRRPVTLDCIEYFYNPKDLKDRLLRARLWRGGKWRSKDEVGRQRAVSLSEGEKKEFPIEEMRLVHLDKVAKVCVLDQTGRHWPVLWPTPRQLVLKTRHGELDRIEEENPRRTCKIVGYYLRDDFYIFALWNKEPPSKSSSIGRTFHFDRRDAYARKLEEIRSVLLPKLLAEEIEEIT